MYFGSEAKRNMDMTIDGVKTHYLDIGANARRATTPIVLIHGFPFSHEMWAPQLELLKKEEFRVIAYDIRGHGLSDVGDGQYTMELFVDDLIALLDHLKIPRAVLCGLSMGGYIALRAVERNPERVAALILCDSGPQADSNEVKLKRAANIKSVKTNGVKIFAEGFVKATFAPESFETRRSEIERIRKIIESNSEVGICGTLLALVSRTDTTEVLDLINVPTLIMVGELDKVTPPKLSELMNSKIPTAELHILPKAAHMSNLENAQEFGGHLSKFLLGLV
ncbi:MAG: alpha/beta fold hydrolase [Nitrososphaerales archaeon]